MGFLNVEKAHGLIWSPKLTKVKRLPADVDQPHAAGCRLRCSRGSSGHG